MIFVSLNNNINSFINEMKFWRIIKWFLIIIILVPVFAFISSLIQYL